MAQVKVWKTPEYWMYFKFFKLKNWVKRSASNRRRINQRLLKKREARSLFRFLSKQLAASGCDHTLRRTEAWLARKFEDEDLRQQVLAEIREDGGYCDCEVILNCYERYELDF